MYESSCGSTSLSAFDLVSVWDFSVSRWCVVVLVILMCSSLMTCDVECLSIRLPDICVSSLVRCLSRSAAHFLIGLFIFSLLSFKNALYILHIRCFLQIFSSSLWPNFWKEIILTHREQIPEGLHHHVPVQGPLSRVQTFPLFWREFNGHILEGQLCLKFETKNT